jgi:hypothetical protein
MAKWLAGPLLALAAAAALAGTAAATVAWPPPDERPSRLADVRQSWRDTYRKQWSRIGRTRHAAAGTVTIGGRAFPLMVSACALPREPLHGYIRVPGSGPAVVFVDVAGSKRYLSVVLPDGRWFLGGAGRGPLRGSLYEPNFQKLVYLRKAEALLGPDYRQELAAMSKDELRAFYDRYIATHVAKTVPRWSWSVRLDCRRARSESNGGESAARARSASLA